MKPHIAWERIQQIRKARHAWELEARQCLEILRDANSVLRLEKGRMNPALVTIVNVSCSERVKVRREDNGKEYWVGTYFLNPTTSGEGRPRAAGKENR